MPTYTFRDTETGVQFDRVLRISQLDEFKKENPHLQQVIGTDAALVRSFNQKPDSNFRDLLKTIKKGSPGSTVNTFD